MQCHTERVFTLGARYRVHHWTLVVSIQCLQCETKPVLVATDTQPAKCPSCGAEYDLGGLRWDVTNPAQTQLGIAATTRLLEPATPQ